MVIAPPPRAPLLILAVVVLWPCCAGPAAAWPVGCTARRCHKHHWRPGPPQQGGRRAGRDPEWQPMTSVGLPGAPRKLKPSAAALLHVHCGICRDPHARLPIPVRAKAYGPVMSKLGECRPSGPRARAGMAEWRCARAPTFLTALSAGRGVVSFWL